VNYPSTLRDEWVVHPKKRIIFTRYRESITEQDVWKLFVSAFNTILKQLQNE